MSNVIKLLVIGVVGAALLVSSVHAQTPDDDAAHVHFSAAASYYERGEYEDALREFQVAFDLSQRPGLFYNLSLCHQQLGQLTEAADYLERYLSEVPEIENRAALTARLGNLRARAERGDTAVGDPETGAVVAETETETETEPEVALVAPPERSESVNVASIVGFSVAALGLVGAGIFGGLTLAENGSLDERCGAVRCVESDLGSLRTFALVTDISLGVALAGAVIGTIFLFVGTGDSEASAEIAPNLRLAPMFGMSTAGPSAGLSMGGAL